MESLQRAYQTKIVHYNDLIKNRGSQLNKETTFAYSTPIQIVNQFNVPFDFQLPTCISMCKDPFEKAFKHLQKFIIENYKIINF